MKTEEKVRMALIASTCLTLFSLGILTGFILHIALMDQAWQLYVERYNATQRWEWWKWWEADDYATFAISTLASTVLGIWLIMAWLSTDEATASRAEKR